MKATDLRIDNLVTDEFYDSFNTILKVESINEFGINLIIEDDGNWPEIASRWIEPELTFDKLRGIPLTEEWLLKFGYKGRKDFKWNGSIVGIQIKDGKFYLGIKDLGNVLFHSVVEINTVHHFQNLYYFLTNEELSYTTKIETPGTITDKEARNFNQGA
jgi:hypothetical protein